MKGNSNTCEFLCVQKICVIVFNTARKSKKKEM